MKRFINYVVMFCIGWVAGGIYGCDWMTTDEKSYNYWKEKYHSKGTE